MNVQMWSADYFSELGHLFLSPLYLRTQTLHFQLNLDFFLL